MLRNFKSIGLLALLLASAGSWAQDQTVTIRFDNSGDENGITTAGTSEFEFMDSSWSGGEVNTRGITRLYASGAFSYEVLDGSGMVVFAQPTADIEFFFVHGSGVPEGTATAFDVNGVALDSVDSNAATSFGDPGNVVSFETSESIFAVGFTGGAIDNFGYTLTDDFVVDFPGVDGQWVTADDAFMGAGEGLTFDFLEFANLLFVAWFTHTAMPEMPSGEPPMDVGAPGNRWLTAQLQVAGNTASGALFRTTGGQFDAPPTDFQATTEVGTMTIEFTACNRATVSYSIDQPALSRTFEIIPLVERVSDGTDPRCDMQSAMAAGDDGGATGGGY